MITRNKEIIIVNNDNSHLLYYYDLKRSYSNSNLQNYISVSNINNSRNTCIPNINNDMMNIINNNNTNAKYNQIQELHHYHLHHQNAIIIER